MMHVLRGTSSRTHPAADGCAHISHIVKEREKIPIFSPGFWADPCLPFPFRGFVPPAIGRAGGRKNMAHLASTE